MKATIRKMSNSEAEAAATSIVTHVLRASAQLRAVSLGTYRNGNGRASVSDARAAERLINPA